ncbi:MAG: hypothetical protein JXJ20_02130 [Anaerolineae bacterium]|nr:hypothetical protein [Anaerolineae bacterium]
MATDLWNTACEYNIVLVFVVLLVGMLGLFGAATYAANTTGILRQIMRVLKYLFGAALLGNAALAILLWAYPQPALADDHMVVDGRCDVSGGRTTVVLVRHFNTVWVQGDPMPDSEYRVLRTDDPAILDEYSYIWHEYGARYEWAAYQRLIRENTLLVVGLIGMAALSVLVALIGLLSSEDAWRQSAPDHAPPPTADN